MQLKDYLSKNKIKREDFANKIGVTQGYVSMLCNHKSLPSLTTAIKIEDATNGEVKARDLLPEKEAA